MIRYFSIFSFDSNLRVAIGIGSVFGIPKFS